MNQEVRSSVRHHEGRLRTDAEIARLQAFHAVEDEFLDGRSTFIGDPKLLVVSDYAASLAANLSINTLGYDIQDPAEALARRLATEQTIRTREETVPGYAWNRRRFLREFENRLYTASSGIIVTTLGTDRDEYAKRDIVVQLEGIRNRILTREPRENASEGS